MNESKKNDLKWSKKKFNFKGIILPYLTDKKNQIWFSGNVLIDNIGIKINDLEGYLMQLRDNQFKIIDHVIYLSKSGVFDICFFDYVKIKNI